MSWMLSCIGCGAKKLPEREETRFLDFQHCLLKSVPFEVFQNERILQELILDSNQISELPRELFHCHELCILSLSDNDLQILPAAMSSLINLQSLNFCKNGISDIPDSIKACKKLSRVDASTNPLCRIPEAVTQLVALRELSLNDTFLDYLPANFGRLTGLEILELRENQLNTLPRSMTRLTSLRRLDLGQNEYSELPEVVGHLISLTDIWFDGNKIRNIPSHIGNLTELLFIDASRNRIREIFPEIGSCQKLTDLYLNSNELEYLPDELCECRQLSTLCLDENNISQLPDNLGELNQLTELNASYNELVELPSSIGLLRELKVLHVNHNLIEQLPPELGSCFQLSILTAAHNQITHLPPELANISRLRVINACANQIQFLPVSFTKLQVTGLWLSENQNKPTVPMQCKIDTPTGQKVLTCYLLPQLPYEEKIYKDDTSELPIPEAEVTRRRAKSLIHFASDKDNDESSLTRIPTPYPKELRALARHTKNLKSLKKAAISNQNDMVPSISPVTHIKNADKKEVEVESSMEIPSTKAASSEIAQDIVLTNTNQEKDNIVLSSTTDDDNLLLASSKATIELLGQKNAASETSNFIKPTEINNSWTNVNHKSVEVEDEFPTENGNTLSLLSPTHELSHISNEFGLNNVLKSKEINLSLIRPASIAAPEISKLEEVTENHSYIVCHKVNWQKQRPGSIATPELHKEVTCQQDFTYRTSTKCDGPLPSNIDICYGSSPISDNYNFASTTTSGKVNEWEMDKIASHVGNMKTIYKKNSSEMMAPNPIIENNESFINEEDSAIDNNQTKIPPYCAPSNSYCSQFSPEKNSPSNYCPSKSSNMKVAYQSKLPTLGTPNKTLLSQSVSETFDGINKTRIPIVSPPAKLIKSPKENFSSPGKTTDSLFKLESRIPSFSSKHSTFGLSPVEKPINTTGIPAMFSPSRDSAINSSLKKKSGIPLSKGKALAHQVSPTEKGLKSGANEAWK